ncbi:peptidoglycan-binding protein [Microbulbifer sp. CnH-101-E]|uniref:peptidoglycan-binding protein n=1 Tax=unclassified Microbulbifer TaxID=2619833 RepID=UPI0040391417
MILLDSDFIFAVAPKFSGNFAKEQSRIIEAVAVDFSKVLDDYLINTPLRIAHFMGQVTHESAGFRTTEEFASGAAYEGRKDLGHIYPGDGKRYKGRGLIQLTGRYNYRKIGKKLGLPLEENPELAAEPTTSLKIACEYWKSRSINQPADRDDLAEVTRRVQGGDRHIKERRKYLRKAKQALANLSGMKISFREGETSQVLHRGSSGSTVTKLQKLLQDKGFGLTVDSDFGPATELAVKIFQKQNNLVEDGIVGGNTWKVLRS